MIRPKGGLIMIDTICEYIISTVIEYSSDCQYCVDFDLIESKFNIVLDENNLNSIFNALLSREEIADVTTESDCFDVVVYTKFTKG